MPRRSHSRTVSGETPCSRANDPVVSMTGKVLTSVEVLDTYGYNGVVGLDGRLYLMSETTRFFEVPSGWIAGKPAMAAALGRPYKSFWRDSIGPGSFYHMVGHDSDPRKVMTCVGSLKAGEDEHQVHLTQSRLRSNGNLIRWERTV